MVEIIIKNWQKQRDFKLSSFIIKREEEFERNRIKKGGVTEKEKMEKNVIKSVLCQQFIKKSKKKLNFLVKYEKIFQKHIAFLCNI